MMFFRSQGLPINQQSAIYHIACIFPISIQKKKSFSSQNLPSCRRSHTTQKKSISFFNSLFKTEHLYVWKSYGDLIIVNFGWLIDKIIFISSAVSFHFFGFGKIYRKLCKVQLHLKMISFVAKLDIGYWTWSYFLHAVAHSKHSIK